MIKIIVIVTLMFCNSAFAVVASVTSASSMASSLPASLQWIAATPGLVVVPPVSGATASNRLGYSPVIASDGSAQLQTSLPVSLSPPAGSAPSAAQIASATALAGAGLAGASVIGSAGDIGVSVPLGAGVGSAAFNLGMAALGMTVNGVLSGGNPLVLAMSALPVGQAGYALYQALNAQGLSSDSSGVLLKSSTPPVVAGVSSSNCPVATVGSLQTLYYLSSGSQCSEYSIPSSTCAAAVGASYCVANFTFGPVNPFPASGPSPSSSAPAVTSDVVSALGSAVSVPAVAADAAALAINNGVDISAAIDAASANATISAINLASQFSVLSSSVDSLGNTTATLQRSLLSSPASSASAPSAPVLSNQSVQVSNGIAQTVTSSPVPLSIPAVVPSGGLVGVGTSQTAAQQATDLCVQHPDALACSNDAQIGDVPLAPLTVQPLAVSLVPVPVGGLAACPAPYVIAGSKFTSSFTFDYLPVCNFFSMLKPFVLAAAWLGAGLIVFSGRPYA